MSVIGIEKLEFGVEDLPTCENSCKTSACSPPRNIGANRSANSLP